MEKYRTFIAVPLRVRSLKNLQGYYEVIESMKDSF